MWIDIEPDRALFESRVDLLVAIMTENERPLAGLSGVLDWRFGGAISRSLRSGAIEGKPGECVLFPITKNGKVFRMILAGAGASRKPGERVSLPEETWRALAKNLKSLKAQRVGISKKDLGNCSDELIVKHLMGVPYFLTQ